MRKRIFITGGAGFVGSHLARGCLKEGWEVAIAYQPAVGLDQIKDLRASVTLFPVHNEYEQICSAFSEFRPDLVYHLASVFIAKHAPGDIPSLVQSNIEFGTLILEAMARMDVPYLVNTGTSWQHFEDRAFSPVNLYAATKQAFEAILTYYVETTRMRAITLKLYDTYGADDPRPKLFALLKEAAFSQQPLEMSPGEQFLDVVYIDDVVRAYLLAAKRLFTGKAGKMESYAVSSGEPIRLRDLVEKFQEITGHTFPIYWGRRPYREREVMQPWKTGKSLPGWNPEISLEEGIKKIMGKEQYGG